MTDNRRKHRFLSPSTVACLLSLQIVAFPVDAWRCGTRLIEPGQTQYEVTAKCGDPEEVEYRNEWRLQTVLQQQCNGGFGGYPQPGLMVPAVPQNRYRPPPGPVCFTVPLSYSVPVEVAVWYYEDSSVPKALFFEQGRLVAIESLWGLRH